ncbi:MAG: cytochrome c [Hydrogenophaga sp.]|nr:cytochrome c [Hydrogenophaga sp.]
MRTLLLMVPVALASVLANPALAADPVAGRTKAAAACAVCHGPNGVSMAPNAPHLAGQPAIYLVEQLKNYRSGKRPHEVMGVIAKPLTDTEIDDLAAWYGSLQISVQMP